MTIPDLKRSPSPLSSRPTPNSRNSESNSKTRRSFSGNPFQKPSALVNARSFNPHTPANSPSGFGRRLSDHYEKENDQSIKPNKSRSAAIGFGSKNFMAPTISAACKMSPSPRKKVLVDRNDIVRTSISSNDENILSKFESSMDQKNAEASVPKVLKKVRFAAASTLDSGNSIEFEADSVVVSDLNTKINSFFDSNTSPNIAPLDADPLVLPYDPKTNYLSPRPQFLHYKPNERIEILLNKENGLDNEGVKLFEDKFSSFDNSSNANHLKGDPQDSSSAEIEPPKVREEELFEDKFSSFGNSDELQRDPQDSSSAEIEPPKIREEELFEDKFSSFDNSSDTDELQRDPQDSAAEIEPPKVREEDVHGSKSLICGKKKGLVTRLGLILLLVLTLGSCFSLLVTYSPGIDSTMLTDMNISQLHQPGAIIDLAKANFKGFTQKFKQLSVESISHLSLLINNLGQEAQLSSLQFCNLTELQNDNFDGGYLKIQQGSEKSPEYLEWDYMEEKIDESFEEDTFEDSIPDSSSGNEMEKDGDDLVQTEAFPAAAASETICNQEADISHLNTDWQDNVVPEHILEIQEVIAESSIEEVEVNVNLGSDVNVKPSSEDINLQTESDVSIESSPEEIQEVLTENSLEKVEGYVNLHSADPNVKTLSENISLKTPSDIIPHPTTQLPSDIEPLAYYVIGATALILAVVSIAFAVYQNKMRGNNANEPNNAVSIDHLLSKKTTFATSSSTMEKMYKEKQCSQNWSTEDDVEESSSAEMSSFQRNSSQYEAQSGGERRQRKYSNRESFSSSGFSLGGGGGGGSTSYGSFTTFERISIKNATRDDEVVTPVRRSSRLRRSQVTS